MRATRPRLSDKMFETMGITKEMTATANMTPPAPQARRRPVAAGKIGDSDLAGQRVCRRARCADGRHACRPNIRPLSGSRRRGGREGQPTRVGAQAFISSPNGQPPTQCTRRRGWKRSKAIPTSNYQLQRESVAATWSFLEVGSWRLEFTCGQRLTIAGIRRHTGSVHSAHCNETILATRIRRAWRAPRRPQGH